MFIGHWAPAIAIAARRSRPGLGTLFVAAQLIDWAFFALLLLGVEHMRFSPGISVMNPMDLYDMHLSHSLSGTGGFAMGAAALYLLLTRDRLGTVLVAAAVLSHWLLDLLVHVPDLTLNGSPPKLGLGLWNYPAIEMPLELAITFGALWYYARRRRPAPLRLAVLGGVLLVLQAFNWFVPVGPEVGPETSVLVFFAYGVATLAAWWMGKSAANPAQAV